MKNRGAVFIFLRTLAISTLVFGVLGTGIFFAYMAFTGKFDQGVSTGLEEIKDNGILPSIFDTAPEKVNFLILGTDGDGTRTDTIIVGCFLPKEGRIALVSVPRDTMVTMPEDRLNIVKSYNDYAPDDGVMKLNEVHHHAGKENGIEFVQKQIEELLGINLDFYAEINLEGLRYVVDALGGVTFNVPERMYYKDPIQNLLINLQPGEQLLDGDQAEQLIRYRSYVRGDLQRVEVQQQFMKAMAGQILASDSLWQKMPSLISASLKYMRTDFNITDVPKYLKYAKNISVENIVTFTLPTTTTKRYGKDYQLLVEDETQAIIQYVFEEGFPPAPVDNTSMGKSISVLNGGTTAGLAGKTKDRLNADGFTVEHVGDYNGQKQVSTRIIVNAEGQGQDLTDYFVDSKIEVNPSFTNDYDIVIILGTLEN